MIIGGNGYIGSFLKERFFAVGMNPTTIYLAFMSNNDMCERNPELARKLNTKSFSDMLNASNGRFIFASSVSVYGDCVDAQEDSPMNPTTLYGQHKVLCEELLKASSLDYTIVRSASVCGYSPRMRYDLMVNRMVRDAARTGKITVNGGEQKRSHIHINDLCRFYAWLLENPQPRQTFNVVCENQSVMDTAILVARTIGKTTIDVKPYTDKRSYTVSGEKMRKAGFECESSIEDAIISVYLNTLYD